MHQAVPLTGSLQQLGPAILRRRCLHADCRLRRPSPLLVLLQHLLRLTHRSQKQLQPLPVRSPHSTRQTADLPAHTVQNTATIPQSLQLTQLLVSRSRQKQSPKHLPSPTLRRNPHSPPIPRGIATSQHQRWKTSQPANLRCRLLLQRNPVPDVILTDLLRSHPRK